ncbi:MAG: DUF3619 family protein [Rhodocyclaceae bacterium]|nr:DUF3619 family protein [Rhodocyclaceae bacterium]MCB1964168.1 DUF3619 family protein [Rhodocyclaceae bacterium]
MNPQQQFGRRVAHLLSEGSAQLDDAVLARLRHSRQQAVAARRRGFLAALLSAPRRWALLPALRPALTAALVLAVFLAGDYVNSERTLARQGEVETALLADDLPIDAYLDQGFRAWLQSDSRS